MRHRHSQRFLPARSSSAHTQIRHSNQLSFPAGQMPFEGCGFALIHPLSARLKSRVHPWNLLTAGGGVTSATGNTRPVVDRQTMGRPGPVGPRERLPPFAHLILAPVLTLPSPSSQPTRSCSSPRRAARLCRRVREGRHAMTSGVAHDDALATIRLSIARSVVPPECL